MADGAASVPLLLGAGLLVGVVYEAAAGFVARRIDEDAETSAVLAGPAKRLVIVLALALAASLLAEQLAVDEGVADLVGVGITTNWGTLRWARNLVVLTAALHSVVCALQVTWLTRRARGRWRKLGRAALARYDNAGAGAGSADDRRRCACCRRRRTPAAEPSDGEEDDGTEGHLHWPFGSGADFPWSCSARRRSVEIARWHAQRKLFLRSMRLPEHFDVTSYLRRQLSAHSRDVSLAFPAGAWILLVLAAAAAAAVDLLLLDDATDGIPHCLNGTAPSSALSSGTVEGGVTLAVIGLVLLLQHLLMLVALRARRNRWLVVWGAPAPARLAAALAAPPAAQLTATAAASSSAIAGPWLWRLARTSEQLGRLGQCAVLSVWLLTDFRGSFGHSLCDGAQFNCSASVPDGHQCVESSLLNAAILISPVLAMFGPAVFNRALPDAAGERAYNAFFRTGICCS